MLLQTDRVLLQTDRVLLQTDRVLLLPATEHCSGSAFFLEVALCSLIQSALTCGNSDDVVTISKVVWVNGGRKGATGAQTEAA